MFTPPPPRLQIELRRLVTQWSSNSDPGTTNPADQPLPSQPYLQMQHSAPTPSSAAAPQTQPRQQQQQLASEPSSSSIPRPWTSPDAGGLKSSSSYPAPLQQQHAGLPTSAAPSSFRPRTAAAAQQQYVASNYTSPDLTRAPRPESAYSVSSTSVTANAGVPFHARLVASSGGETLAGATPAHGVSMVGGSSSVGGAGAVAGSMNMQQLAAALVPQPGGRPATASGIGGGGGYISGISSGISAGESSERRAKAVCLCVENDLTVVIHPARYAFLLRELSSHKGFLADFASHPGLSLQQTSNINNVFGTAAIAIKKHAEGEGLALCMMYSCR